MMAGIHEAAAAAIVQHLGAPHGLVARLQALPHVLHRTRKTLQWLVRLIPVGPQSMAGSVST